MKGKEIGLYDCQNNLIKTYSGITALCNERKISQHTILDHIKTGKEFNGIYYRYTGNIIKKEHKKRINNSQNVCFDITQIKHKDKWNERICPICGKVFYARIKYDKITCSKECYDKYIEEHKEDIYKKVAEKVTAAFKIKTPEEKQEIKDKIKATCLEKYGVESYQKTEESRSAVSLRYKNKDWSKRSNNIKKKLYTKYSKICENDNLTLLEFKNRFNCTVQCNCCKNIFNIHVLGYLTDSTTKNLCRHCHPIENFHINSYPSVFIENILKENNIEYVKNDRIIINPQEIDLLIPSLKIGFEINGNFWHSEIAGHKDKKYHINKTLQAYEKDYKLIHIFEDEIINKPDIVRSRVLNLIGKTQNKLGARKCYIKEIDSLTKKEFLEKNHIDGDALSKINIGLFYNDILVSVATFGKRKISSKSYFELIRFANKINYNVIGGFSKILAYFQKKYQNEDLITYADIRWSGINPKDTVYTKNGFTFIKNTQPNYFYVDKTNYLLRLNRMNFTKQKLREKNIYEDNLTESQIMFKNNFDRLWNCGSMKFILNKKPR